MLLVGNHAVRVLFRVLAQLCSRDQCPGRYRLAAYTALPTTVFLFSTDCCLVLVLPSDRCLLFSYRTGAIRSSHPEPRSPRQRLAPVTIVQDSRQPDCDALKAHAGLPPGRRVHVMWCICQGDPREDSGKRP
jgi:hypothetical protein